MLEKLISDNKAKLSALIAMAVTVATMYGVYKPAPCAPVVDPPAIEGSAPAEEPGGEFDLNLDNPPTE